jgi:(+)-trans-carveol dehydrogenase
MRADRLQGKVAFITGVARGQGRWHAVRMAQEGADIIGLDRCAAVATMGDDLGTPEVLAETVALVEAQGRRILARQIDVRDRDSVGMLLADGVAEFGRLDIVVANAGISPPAIPMWTITPEQWDDVIGINLTGVFNTLSLSVPHTRKAHNGGSIVVISSAARSIASRT